MAKPAEDPKKFQWRVFAEDILHNSCGIEVISKDEIIVSQMPELTRIKDTDGDGIADLYETISDKWGMSGNYHETNTIVPDKKAAGISLSVPLLIMGRTSLEPKVLSVTMVVVVVIFQPVIGKAG